MKMIAKMQAIITHLLEKQGLDVTEPTTFLWLALPGRAERLVIERIDLRYLSVALAHTAAADAFSQDPQLFFATAATGWTPIHGEGAAAVGDLTRFAEAWAQRILDEGWLERGEPLPEPPWAVTPEPPWVSMTNDEEQDNPDAAPGSQEEPCDLPF